jgi:DNA-directed RNA polymerase omega subunit
MPKKAETKVDKKADKKSVKAKDAAAAEVEETGADGAEGHGKVMHDIDSKYRMILLAAQRSKQLQKGATVRVGVDSRKHKHTFIALQEIKEKKVPFEFLEEEEE